MKTNTLPKEPAAPRAPKPERPRCQFCFGSGRQQDQVAFGAALRAKRTKLDVQGKTAAKGMGITQGYLCDLEKGRRTWTLELKTKFEEMLEKNVNNQNGAA